MFDRVLNISLVFHKHTKETSRSQRNQWEQIGISRILFVVAVKVMTLNGHPA